MGAAGRMRPGVPRDLRHPPAGRHRRQDTQTAQADQGIQGLHFVLEDTWIISRTRI